MRTLGTKPEYMVVMTELTFIFPCTSTCPQCRQGIISCELLFKNLASEPTSVELSCNFSVPVTICNMIFPHLKTVHIRW